MKKNFLWGGSSSAYQFEGESLTHGKGKSIQDVVPTPEGVTDFKIASDHYNHYKEDVALLSELGLKSYRFSISWTRIIPNGVGEVNQEGIDFYKNLIKELKAKNIEPIVTMYHFDLPLELEKKGGWNNRELMLDAFENYAKVLFENFGKDVNYWLTINEQNLMLLFGQILDLNKSKTRKELFNENHTMALAEARVYKLCHKMTKAKIGPAPNIAFGYPASCKPEDVLASQYFNAYRNWVFLDISIRGEYNNICWKLFKDNDWTPTVADGDMKFLKENKPDFIAFNYYATYTIRKPIDENNSNKDWTIQTAFDTKDTFEVVENEFLPLTEYGWEIDPIGFRVTLRELWDRYHLPLMITENGLGAKDVLTEDFKIHDQYRIDFLKAHISELKKATEEGIDVFSYNPWSAIDLASTHEGFNKRYGFIYVNRDEFDLKDLKRYKKDSFFWYNKVISSNGEEL